MIGHPTKSPYIKTCRHGSRSNHQREREKERRIDAFFPEPVALFWLLFITILVGGKKKERNSSEVRSRGFEPGDLEPRDSGRSRSRRSNRTSLTEKKNNGVPSRNPPACHRRGGAGWPQSPAAAFVFLNGGDPGVIYMGSAT